MSWFTKKARGVDLQVLQKTKFWDALEQLIETDKQTHQKLVQYVYEQVSDSIISELQRMELEADKMTVIQDARNYIAHRTSLLTKYKEMAYGSPSRDIKSNNKKT